MQSLGVNHDRPRWMQWGTESSKKRYSSVLSGAQRNLVRRGCQSMARGPIRRDSDRAVLEGAILQKSNGQKVRHPSPRAGFRSVFVRTRPELPKPTGMSALLGRHECAPCTRQSRSSRSRPPICRVQRNLFEDVRVPKEKLLGPINRGWQVLVSSWMP